MCNWDARNSIGWCIYCKEEIYENDIHVIVDDKLYHKDCYNLIEEES